jgi:hypothetical protein
VIVVLLAPLLAVIVSGAAVTVDCAALTPAAITVTVVVWVTPVPSIVTDTVFPSATVALNDPVTTPLASVVVPGCVIVFPLPVAANTAEAPWIGFPNSSRAVTVIVVLLAPLLAVIVPGTATTLDCPACTPAVTTVTVAVCVTPVPPIIAETTLSPAPVALSVPVATPFALVIVGCVTAFPVPVAVSTTAAPSIGLPN